MVTLRDDRSEVLSVPPEELVCTHARQQHLHTCVACCLAHQQGVDGGRITDRLVQDVHDSGQKIHNLRCNLDFVQPDAELGRDLARVQSVVRHRFEELVLRPEANGVRVDIGVVTLGQDRHDAGI